MLVRDRGNIMKILKTANYKKASQGYLRIAPSDSGENLYNLSISNHSNPNLGGQVIASDLTSDEVEMKAQELSDKWDYEIIREEQSTSQRYDSWLDTNKQNKTVPTMNDSLQ